MPVSWGGGGGGGRGVGGVFCWDVYGTFIFFRPQNRRTTLVKRNGDLEKNEEATLRSRQKDQTLYELSF